MLTTTLAVLAFMLIVMGFAWLTVLRTENGGWTDVFWTFGTGISGVAAALQPLRGAPDARQLLVAALVALWSIRLGGYIARRVATGPEDARYASLKTEWGERFGRNLLGVALVQAPVTAILSLSVAVAALRPAAGLGLQDYAGAAILLAAIAGEGLADDQMRRFKADKANHGKVMDQGLWAWSRHPNYLFEALGWVAYPVIALDLSGAWPWGLASLAAPVAMAVILNLLTGVPPLEAAMLRSRGEAYRAYQARVSRFLPRPPKGPAR